MTTTWRYLPLYAADPDPKPEDWQERALCREVGWEPFFPGEGESTLEAKRICSGCEVREPCLEAALARNELWGIYGGLDRRGRVGLQRARDAAAVEAAVDAIVSAA